MVSAVEFLTFDDSPFWDTTRVLFCVLCLYMIIRMAYLVRREPIDSFQRWVFVGLSAFALMVAFQAVVAWGQPVPIFRPLLGWTGVIAALVAIHRRNQTHD